MVSYVGAWFLYYQLGIRLVCWFTFMIRAVYYSPLDWYRRAWPLATFFFTSQPCLSCPSIHLEQPESMTLLWLFSTYINNKTDVYLKITTSEIRTSHLWTIIAIAKASWGWTLLLHLRNGINRNQYATNDLYISLQRDFEFSGLWVLVLLYLDV